MCNHCYGNENENEEHHDSKESMAHRMSRRAFLVAASLGLGAAAFRFAQTVSTTPEGPSPQLASSQTEATATPTSSVRQIVSEAPRSTATTVPPSPEQATPTAAPAPTDTPGVTQSAAAPATEEAVQPLAETPTVAAPQPMPMVVEAPPIVSQANWGAVPAIASLFVPHQLERITLHHEGVIFDGSMTAPAYLRAVQRWSITNRGWPDVPYHFMIGLDGTIYEGRPLEMRGDTNTGYSTQGMAQVALLGKYDAGEQVPTQAQIDAVIDLMAWIAATYRIPPDAEHIKGHRDYIPFDDTRGFHVDTRTGQKITCPGDNLYVYLQNGTILSGIADRLALASNSTATPTSIPDMPVPQIR